MNRRCYSHSFSLLLKFIHSLCVHVYICMCACVCACVHVCTYMSVHKQLCRNPFHSVHAKPETTLSVDLCLLPYLKQGLVLLFATVKTTVPISWVSKDSPDSASHLPLGVPGVHMFMMCIQPLHGFAHSNTRAHTCAASTLPTNRLPAF